VTQWLLNGSGLSFCVRWFSRLLRPRLRLVTPSMVLPLVLPCCLALSVSAVRFLPLTRLLLYDINININDRLLLQMSLEELLTLQS